MTHYNVSRSQFLWLVFIAPLPCRPTALTEWTRPNAWRLEATKEVGQGAREPVKLEYWIATAA